MKKVEVAVVVEVGETASPSPISHPSTCPNAHVGEPSPTIVFVEAVTGDTPVSFGNAIGIPDAGHEPVEVPIIVEGNWGITGNRLYENVDVTIAVGVETHDPATLFSVVQAELG